MVLSIVLVGVFLSRQIGGVEERLGERINRVESRIDRLESRVERIESDLADTRERLFYISGLNQPRGAEPAP